MSAHDPVLGSTDGSVVRPGTVGRERALVAVPYQVILAFALTVRVLLVQPARLDAGLLVQAQEVLAGAGGLIRGKDEVWLALALAADGFFTQAAPVAATAPI